MTEAGTSARPPSLSGELSLLWRLALPLGLAQAGQALMGLVDTAVVGRLSKVALGAAGLGNSLTFTATFFGMGVMLALDPLVSQAIGAGQRGKARALYWQGVWLALATSVVVMAAVVAATFVLEPAGVDPELARGARAFMYWRLPGIPASLLFVCARSYLQGLGRARPVFVSMLVANVLNLVLDVVLVFGLGPIPPLGLVGAAIATVLCLWAQLWMLVAAFDARPPGTPRRPQRAGFAQGVRVGLPIGLHLLAESAIFSLVGVAAGGLGSTAMAAHQIALMWASLSFSVAMGIGSAAAVRVGWGVGARDTRAARRAGLVAFGSGAAFMGAAALFFLAFPQLLVRAMTDQAEVLPVAVALFSVTAVFQISDGVQAVGAGALRGLGDTRFTFFANVAGHWLVGFPVAWLLGVRGSYGVVGLWWGLCAGLSVVGAALFVRFERVTRAEVRAL